MLIHYIHKIDEQLFLKILYRLNFYLDKWNTIIMCEFQFEIQLKLYI
jgi:hypothetical protein